MSPKIARTYKIPLVRLPGPLQGRKSRLDHPGANRKLSEDQELAVYQYLDRLDAVGTSARIPMVSSCGNAILGYGHTGPDPLPPVGDHWVPCFLDPHPDYHIRKQKTIHADRKDARQPDNIRAWLKNILLYAKSTIFSRETNITWIRPAFALELAVTN